MDNGSLVFYSSASILAALVVIAAYRTSWRARGKRRAQQRVSAPRTLEPPLDRDTSQWRDDWVRSVRETPGEIRGVDGHATAIARHLFLGTAVYKEICWRERATPTDYWAEGEVRAWGHQKYRDWEQVGPCPLYLDEELLRRHAYIVGPTGSGKSSLAIMSLLKQLIDGHVVLGGGRSPKRPVVILDLKGDNALFYAALHAAAARGQRFKFFNLEHGAPTYRFNPFRGFNPLKRSIMQLCQLVLDALALNHGRLYGRGYYTERSRAALMKALEENPSVSTFKELHEALRRVLRNERDKRARTDAFELLSVVETLSRYPQLVTSLADEGTNRDGIIYMPDVLAERQVVYFWLPAALESISAGEIAKLVLFNLRAAAQDYKRDHPTDPLQCVLVIDELQRVAGENLAGILQDARSFGIGAILANQSVEDLKSPNGFDLGGAVLTNTVVKLMFTHQDDSKFYAFIQRSRGLTRARPYPARFDPLLRDLRLEDLAYEVTSAWPISRECYDRWDATPLPGWDAIPGGDWSQAMQQAAPAAPTEDDVRRAQLKFIASLFNEFSGGASKAAAAG